MLTAVGFVGTPAGQRLDGWLLPRAERGGGYEQPTDLVEPARTVLAWFGDPAVLGLLLGGVLLLGVLGRRAWAGAAGVCLVGAAVTGAGLGKQLLLRPDFAVPSSTAHNSFPSGHVAAAMALLLAVLLVLPAPARWWCAVPGTAGVCVVAAATMIAGWHRFSDVLGGVLLATMLCCLVAAVLARPRPDAGAAPAAVPLGLFGLPGLFGLLGLLGGVPLLGLLVGEAALSREPGSGGVGGGLPVVITATCALVVMIVAAVLLLARSTEFGGPERVRNRTTRQDRADRYHNS
ncbi:phosphatase PAP2 family protein [Plantactinospora sp. WMMB782]|uniref:phosphatase PAP2 family protein n=1 Tax=Plantactinospora sp. WMMB782 TaxID=3404121 RepID=UPI003B939D5B